MEAEVIFEPLPDTTPVPIVEHTNGCRWPIYEHPTLYCNEATVFGKLGCVYCDAHTKISYSHRYPGGNDARPRR